MKKELSSLLDNELEAHQVQPLLAALRNDAELRGAMTSYQLIGDALRGSPGLATNLTARVAARLASEPTILAPPNPRAVNTLRHLTALAASAAGIAVVAWLALTPTEPQTMPPLAKAAKPEVVAASERMQEYLMVHQAYSPSSRIQGGSSYIRSISASR